MLRICQKGVFGRALPRTPVRVLMMLPHILYLAEKGMPFPIPLVPKCVQHLILRAFGAYFQ